LIARRSPETRKKTPPKNTGIQPFRPEIT
jgi:hypothetical protein